MGSSKNVYSHFEIFEDDVLDGSVRHHVWVESCDEELSAIVGARVRVGDDDVALFVGWRGWRLVERRRLEERRRLGVKRLRLHWWLRMRWLLCSCIWSQQVAEPDLISAQEQYKECVIEDHELARAGCESSGRFHRGDF